MKKPWQAMLMRGVLLFCIAGSLFTGLRGIGETLSPWSQATVSILANLFYAEDGRDRVTVLLFREQDLDSVGDTEDANGKKTRIPFPVPYAIHLKVLDALAAREPSAIFIDFAFVDRRAGDDVAELRDLFCDLKRMNIPVYLAAFNYWAPDHGLRKDLFVPREKEEGSAPCFRVVPVSYHAEKNDSVLTYELVQKAGDGKGTAPSAALSLFPRFNANEVSAYFDRMDIVWGSLPPREHRSDTPCAPIKLIESAVRLAKDGPGSLTRDCPYSNTLSVYSLLNETGTGDDDDIGVLVKGKVVLYGSAFQGADDRFKSPVHGIIPGVYLHAMALDNLIVFNQNAAAGTVANRYKRIGAHTFNGFVTLELAADLLLIVCGVLWHLVVANFRHTIGHRTRIQQLSPESLRHSLLFYLPYMLLSLALMAGLARAGMPWIGGFQFVVVLALPLLLRELMLLEKRTTVPSNRLRRSPNREVIGANAGFMIRDLLVDISWLAFIAVLCGVAFFWLDLGPRNFWAFAAFIGVTGMADARMSAIARHLYVWRVRTSLANYRRKTFWATALITLGVWLCAYTIFDLTPRGGYANVLYACVVCAFCVGVVAYLMRYSRWLYQDDIHNLKLRKGT